MTLKEAGIDFKRIPLPEFVVQITPDKYTPEIKKGSKKSVIHDVNKLIVPSLEFKKDLGCDFKNFITRKAETQLSIIIDQKDQELIWLDYKEHGDLIENNHIYVMPYSKGTVVMDYNNLENSVHHGLTRIVVGEGAELTLIKIQNNHLDSQFIDQTLTEIHDNGLLKVVDIQLGSKNMIINYDTNLKGYKSKCVYKSLYMAADDRGLDLSFTANHIGKKTQSDILGKGVLGGKAKKVFRGTLHFERGAVQSVGKEEEVVLLLSETVKSDSIPALMCSEDDVIGEHGASIGQLDENRLFYLMSRGLSEKEAKLLVISSSFKEVIEEMTDEDIKLKSLESVDRSINYVIA